MAAAKRERSALPSGDREVVVFKKATMAMKTNGTRTEVVEMVLNFFIWVLFFGVQVLVNSLLLIFIVMVMVMVAAFRVQWIVETMHVRRDGEGFRLETPF